MDRNTLLQVYHTPIIFSSGIGGSVHFTNGGSGTNDGDVNRLLASSISGDTDVYTSFLLELDSARASQDYFFHVAPDPLSFTYRGRVRARDIGTGWSFWPIKEYGHCI